MSKISSVQSFGLSSVQSFGMSSVQSCGGPRHSHPSGPAVPTMVPAPRTVVSYWVGMVADMMEVKRVPELSIGAVDITLCRLSAETACCPPIAPTCIVQAPGGQSLFLPYAPLWVSPALLRCRPRIPVPAMPCHALPCPAMLCRLLSLYALGALSLDWLHRK